MQKGCIEMSVKQNEQAAQTYERPITLEEFCDYKGITIDDWYARFGLMRCSPKSTQCPQDQEAQQLSP